MKEAFDKGEMVGLVKGIKVVNGKLNRATGFRLACPVLGAAHAIDVPEADLMASDGALRNLEIYPTREYTQRTLISWPRTPTTLPTPRRFARRCTSSATPRIPHPDGFAHCQRA